MLLSLILLSTFILSCKSLGTTVPDKIRNPTSTLSNNYKEEQFLKWFEDSLEEVIEPRSLEVIGNIPSYVQGSLVRNGPGVFGSSKRRYSHVFDGLAKLAKFKFTAVDENHISVSFSTPYILVILQPIFLKLRGMKL